MIYNVTHRPDIKFQEIANLSREILIPFDTAKGEDPIAIVGTFESSAMDTGYINNHIGSPLAVVRKCDSQLQSAKLSSQENLLFSKLAVLIMECVSFTNGLEEYNHDMNYGMDDVNFGTCSYMIYGNAIVFYNDNFHDRRDFEVIEELYDIDVEVDGSEPNQYEMDQFFNFLILDKQSGHSIIQSLNDVKNLFKVFKQHIGEDSFDGTEWKFRVKSA